MIINDQCIQAEYVKKYHLGFIISDINNIKNELENYILNFDYSKYQQGRIDFLNIVISDYKIFSNSIMQIIKK